MPNPNEPSRPTKQIRPMRTIRPTASMIETLEPRIVLSASALAVARALDLMEGVTVTLSGNPLQFATQTLGATGQLLGFPSGGDGDFLILSTGIASHVTTLQNLGDAQGTDLGPEGEAGDEASVFFTLPVPVGASNQRLKLDFMFLTEEYPEFLNAGFNDTFQVLINGVNYATDEMGNLVEVDNAYFTGDSAPGTFFDGRTNKLTLTYVIPEGVTSLDVELRLTDVGDGILDSAVLVDNVRFESPQVVYLNFGGQTVANHFGPGMVATLPGFSAADLGSQASTEELIAQIVAGVSAKYGAYDVVFTTTRPTEGDYTTVIVGGDNDILLDISNASPLLQRAHPGASLALSTLYGLGGDSLLGFAGAPDVGNLNRNDTAVIFSGEFDDFFTELSPQERMEHLIVTIAHELGHNFGLRHVGDANSDDIMKQTAPRSPGAVFGTTLIQLAEEWSDGATHQNDDAYLTSVLGKANATGLSPSAPQNTVSFSTAGQTLYNVTMTISGSDPDAAPIVMHFDQLDGSQNVPLPLLPDGAKISLTAASKLGGALDVFSGKQSGGELSAEASSVALFGADGNLVSIPLSKGSPGALVNNGVLPLFENHLGAVTLLPKKTGTFTDSDGDVYTVTLKGPGTIGYVLNDADGDGRGGLIKLAVDGTTSGESVLSVTVLKKNGGDGMVDIGQITGTLGAGLKSLSAGKANLTGDGIIFSGALGSVKIRDLENGANLIAGAGEGVVSKVVLHKIGDGSDIAFGTDVSLLQAARVGVSAVTVASLAKLVVKGDTKLGIGGDIAGEIHVEGLLGKVKARDLLSTAIIEAGGSALEQTQLNVHEVWDGVRVTLASGVSSLTAARIGDAVFKAQRFDSIAIKGDARSFLQGDFEGSIEAASRIGKFTAHDMIAGARLTGGGIATDLTVLKVHAIENGVGIDLESSFGTFAAAEVGIAVIQCASVTNLVVTGDARAGLSGNFLADLSLSGGGFYFENVLVSAAIKGSMVDATIIADSIGNLTAREMLGTNLYVGFAPADAMNPMAGGVFYDGGMIKKLTIKTGGYADSVIASGQIRTISVAQLVSGNGGQEFGLLLDGMPKLVSIQGFAYDKNGSMDQSIGDFHVKVV